MERSLDKHQNETAKEIAFEAFLNGATQFCGAADLLVSGLEPHKLQHDPAYVLYFHATELALKAFLRFSGKTTAELKKDWSHDIEGLYGEALAFRLAPHRAIALKLQNVVYLLHAGNRDQGFRYFTLKSRETPEVRWAGEIVRALITLVETRTGYKRILHEPAVKVDFTFMKPCKKIADTT